MLLVAGPDKLPVAGLMVAEVVHFPGLTRWWLPAWTMAGSLLASALDDGQEWL